MDGKTAYVCFTAPVLSNLDFHDIFWPEDFQDKVGVVFEL